MTPKVAGCCSKCDVEVFDVVRRDAERRPLQLGAAHDDAVRATFVLMNGSRMDLTFCAACAESLTSADHPWLWARVMASWVHEKQPDHSWAKSQVDNGIAGMLHKQLWTEVA